MRVLMLLVLVFTLGGCGFAQGFRDESARQLAEFAASEVERKLGDEFSGVSEALKGVGESIPKKEPLNDGLLYTLGGLVAYVVGSYGKGKIRERREKGRAA